jgi:hypothetical protein
MNLKRYIFLMVILGLGLFFLQKFTHAETGSSNYGFDISIHPEPAKPGVFQAKFVISELTSGKVVAAPTIRFRAGEQAETNAGDAKDGINFKFSVSVDVKGSLAEYTAVVLNSNTEMSRSQAKISLRNL